MTGRRSGSGWIAGCLAIGAAIGVGLQLATPSARGVTLTPGQPTELSASQLRVYAATMGRELYWLGPIEGRRLEVTEAGQRGLFVRYVPTGGALGDQSHSFTTIATYPVEGAYQTAVRSGRAVGSVSQRLASGGLAVWRRSRPSNVYIAFPRSGVLVEIFDPGRSVSRTLARSERVRPVG